MKNKGITLIALIVTIIVLLILAGVSIGLLTGENGILNKAKIAREENEKSSAEENNRLGNYDEYIDQYTTRSGTTSEAKWNKLMMNDNGYVVGNTEILFPNDYEELYIEVKMANSSSVVEFNIPRISLTDTYKKYINGAAANAMSDNCYYVNVNVKEDKMYLSSLWDKGANYISTSIVSVWYR